MNDQNYSQVDFNQLLINKMVDNYGYECNLGLCHSCGRTHWRIERGGGGGGASDPYPLKLVKVLVFSRSQVNKVR